MSRFLNNVDLNKNELRNARIQNLAAPAAAPAEGQVYYDTGISLKTIGVFNGATWAYLLTSLQLGAANGVASLDGSALVIQDPASATATWSAAAKIIKSNSSGKIDNQWINTGAGNGLDADKLDGQEGAFYLGRANHTGTQLSSTISDLTGTITGFRLDQFTAPTADVSMGTRKLINLLDPTNPQDAATKAYVDAAIQGLTPKKSARVGTPVDVPLLSGGAPKVVDGITLQAGNRILVMNQVDKSQNGIYVVSVLGTGVNGVWERASDCDTWAELVSAYTFIEEGTVFADTGWTCIADVGGTISTTIVEWTQFNGAGSFTASSVSIGGVGVFKQKTGSNLEFKGIKAASSRVTISDDVVNNNVTVDVNESALSITNISGTLTVAKGGTGAVTAAGAKTNLEFMTRFAADFGDGAALTYTFTHNLGSADIYVSVYKKSTGELVYPDISTVNATQCSLAFNGVAPTLDEYRVVIIG